MVGGSYSLPKPTNCMCSVMQLEAWSAVLARKAMYVSTYLCQYVVGDTRCCPLPEANCMLRAIIVLLHCTGTRWSHPCVVSGAGQGRRRVAQQPSLQSRFAGLLFLPRLPALPRRLFALQLSIVPHWWLIAHC